jgi:hypothetical protein
VEFSRPPDEHRAAAVRDFKGVSPRDFDGAATSTLGLRDQLLFPEIDYMKVDKARGMNVSVVTTPRPTKRGSCCSSWACRSVIEGTINDGHDRKDRQGTEEAEIQGPAAQPLPSVRPAARLHAEVCPVPSVFPQARA